MTPASIQPVADGSYFTARALLLGDRLDTNGLERDDMLSAAPLAFRVGPRGLVALFRSGVAVLVGLSPVEEDDVLSKIKARIGGERGRIDDETAVVEISPEHDDRIPPGGPLLQDLSP